MNFHKILYKSRTEYKLSDNLQNCQQFAIATKNDPSENVIDR